MEDMLAVLTRTNFASMVTREVLDRINGASVPSAPPRFWQLTHRECERNRSTQAVADRVFGQLVHFYCLYISKCRFTVFMVDFIVSYLKMWSWSFLSF